ncbi:MAG: riboflavin synthase [Terriglobales bacterium]
MFTGLIEEVGRVERVARAAGKRRRGTWSLEVGAQLVARELKRGDSVAVSGVCLTAVAVRGEGFRADLAEETVNRTSISRLQKGALVNLELPMKAGGRLGGHVVQGHVDGVGRLLELRPVEGGEDYWLRAEVPQELARYVVFKGSITIEGISLTVARVVGNEVTCAIIPHTYKATNLHSLRPGDILNLEVDILAKYAEKMFAGEAVPSNVNLERLIREGF